MIGDGEKRIQRKHGRLANNGARPTQNTSANGGKKTKIK
jgi:hypothetical protein